MKMKENHLIYIFYDEENKSGCVIILFFSHQIQQQQQIALNKLIEEVW